MTKAAIIKAITSSNLSQQDLIAINRAVNETYKSQQALACVAAGANFSVGDTVTWSSRRGTFKGELIKINRKNGKVRVGMTTWTVPMTMLQAA
tara:strand:+ start:256 stop:534 length:279 start_codon:yes stop_codon:yes gene_type:complete